MKSTKANFKRILALHPTSHGLAFVVLESITTIADWGVTMARQQIEEKILEKVLKLIRHYKPDIIVIEDHAGSHHYPRIRSLLDGIRRLAESEGLTGRCFSIAKVKQVFRTFHAVTKQEIAHAVAEQLPELAEQVPKPRKTWDSEDYWMGMFHAAALALTYFYSRPVRGADVPKPLTPQPRSPGDPKSS